MNWVNDLFQIMTEPTFWLTFLILSSFLVFIVSWVFSGIVNREMKARGFEYAHLAATKVLRTATALKILSIVSIVITIIILALN